MKKILLRKMVSAVLVVTIGLFAISFRVANAGGVVDVFTSIFAPIIDLVTFPLAIITGNTPNLGDIFGGPIGGFIACEVFDTNGVYWQNCEGGGSRGAFPAISTENLSGCGIPITFYIPQMNMGATTTMTGYREGAEYKIFSGEGGRYSNGPRPSRAGDVGGCTIPDQNGEWVRVDGGKCRKIEPRCELQPNGIDETQNMIEIYRYVKPKTISSRDQSEWFFNGIKSKVGNGFVSKPNLNMEYVASGAPELLATKAYSEICHQEGAGVNECRFFDNTVPKDSYVSYVMKIVGPYVAVRPQSKTYTRGGWIVSGLEKCVYDQNKYLTTASSTDNTLFPYANSGSDYAYGNLVAGPYNTGQMACMNNPVVTLNGPGIVNIPNPVALSWRSENVTECTATGAWSGAKAPSGTETVKSVTAIADRGLNVYNLTCSNNTGTTSASTTVLIKQIPSCSLASSVDSIVPPQVVKLSWNCSYADTCMFDNGVGEVSKQSGTVTVRPTKTTTYTLTCGSPDASIPYSKTINVNTNPRIEEINP